MRFAPLTKIAVLLAASFMVPLISGLLIIRAAIQSDRAVEAMVLRGIQHAEDVSDLDNSLLEQVTLLSLYIHRGGRTLIEDMDARADAFDRQLARIGKTDLSAQERESLDMIGKAYEETERRRRRVIDLCESGQKEKAMSLLFDNVWPAYKETSGLCARMERANAENYLVAARARYLRNVTILVGIGVTINSLVLVGLLCFLLWRLVFPLRGILADYAQYLSRFHQDRPMNRSKDEVKNIAQYFSTLKKDINGSRSDLGLARGRLTETERLTTVGTLAASIAHEIRSPLTSMRLRLFSLVRSLGDDPNVQEDLAVISEETLRLDHIIRNFLEFSRSPKPVQTECRVLDLIDQCIELLRHDLKEHNITLECQVPPDLPAIHADIQQLKQVLINLVNNAIEAVGKDGAIRLTASKGDNSRGEGMVVLRVSDNGPGIPPDFIDKMFRPFISTKENGTGLGLSTAKRIMTLHGGDLVLESTSGKGSVFALWIPLERNSDG